MLLARHGRIACKNRIGSGVLLGVNCYSSSAQCNARTSLTMQMPGLHVTGVLTVWVGLQVGIIWVELGFGAVVQVLEIKRSRWHHIQRLTGSMNSCMLVLSRD